MYVDVELRFHVFDVLNYVLALSMNALNLYHITWYSIIDNREIDKGPKLSIMLQWQQFVICIQHNADKSSLPIFTNYLGKTYLLYVNEGSLSIKHRLKMNVRLHMEALEVANVVILIDIFPPALLCSQSSSILSGLWKH